MLLQYIRCALLSSISLQGFTALIWASFYCHLPMAEALIQAKADLNAQDVSTFCMPLLHTQAPSQSRSGCVFLADIVASCIRAPNYVIILYSVRGSTSA